MMSDELKKKYTAESIDLINRTAAHFICSGAAVFLAHKKDKAEFIRAASDAWDSGVETSEGNELFLARAMEFSVRDSKRASEWFEDFNRRFKAEIYERSAPMSEEQSRKLPDVNFTATFHLRGISELFESALAHFLCCGVTMALARGGISKERFAELASDAYEEGVQIISPSDISSSIKNVVADSRYVLRIAKEWMEADEKRKTK